MDYVTNDLGLPIGLPVPGWSPPAIPPRCPLAGRFCRVEPLDADAHAASLYEADQLDGEGASWTYLPYGPFHDFRAYQEWAAQSQSSQDPLFYAILDYASGRAVGVASYLRITPAVGTIEIGHLHFSPLLQRMPAATEALYLLIENVFSLGFRRVEWKCNALNAASRRAASRLGMSFEGIFRQATVVKGRNRDTAWYSIIDKEWPALQAAFVRWLDTANFGPDGKQVEALSGLTAPLLKDIK